MKWLHLSDIHFDAVGSETTVLRDKLLSYLGKEIVNVDFIFLTGDYRVANLKGNEVETAKNVANFIRQIKDKVKVNEMDRVIVIPGNHDLDRDYSGRAALLSCYENKSNKEYTYVPKVGSIKDVNVLSQSFTFYRLLLGQLFGEEIAKNIYDEQDKNPHWYMKCEDLNVFCLNTELFSSDISDRNIVGCNYVTGLLSANGREGNNIVLAHSSSETLEYDERIQFRKHLKQYGVLLYLCGHKHDIRFDNVNGIYYVEAGCLRHDTGAEVGFTVGELSEDKINITAYHWSNGGWAEYNNFCDGSSQLSIPLERRLTADYSEVISDIKSDGPQINNLSTDTPNILYYIGAWSDINKSDIDFFKQAFPDETYEEVKHNINENPAFLYSDGIFKLSNQQKTLSLLFEILTESDYAMFSIFTKAILVSVLSRQIKKSVANAFAFLSNRLTHNGLAHQFTIDVFNFVKSENIELWKENINLIAEAYPKGFLNWLEEILETNRMQKVFPMLFLSLKAENKLNAFNASYLINALQKLSWSEEYIMKVTCILGKMATISDEPQRIAVSISEMFMPWVKNTTADIDKQKATLKALLNETPDIAWSVLLSLLPNHTNCVLQIKAPTYINLPEYTEKLTESDYNQRINMIYSLILECAGKKPQRISSLLNEIESLFGEAFDTAVDIVAGFIGNIDLDEKTKVELFHKLDEVISKNEHFADADWRLEPKKIETLKLLRDRITPDDVIEAYIRIFGWNNNYGVFLANDEKYSFEENRKRLQNYRAEIIKEIINQKGFSGLEELLRRDTTSTTPNNGSLDIGDIAKAIIITGINVPQEYIFDNIGKKDSIGVFVRSYVSAIINENDSRWSWVDSLDFSNQEKETIANLFLALPFEAEAWKRLETLLGDNISLYWERADEYLGLTLQCYNCNNFDEIEIAKNELLKYNQYASLFKYILRSNGRYLSLKEQFGVIQAFVKLLEPNDPIPLDALMILERSEKEILSSTDSNELYEELVDLEWKLLFAYMNNFYPNAVLSKLSIDANYFKKIVSISYSVAENELEKRKATKLLDYWLSVPGYDRGTAVFNYEVFNNWFVSAISGANDETKEQLEYQIGRTLLFAPADHDGFWIDKRLAQLLENSKSMRKGFCDAEKGIFRGNEMHFRSITKENEMDGFNKYSKLKEETENASFRKFSEMIERIAEYHKREIQRLEKYETTYYV